MSIRDSDSRIDSMMDSDGRTEIEFSSPKMVKSKRRRCEESCSVGSAGGAGALGGEKYISARGVL